MGSYLRGVSKEFKRIKWLKGTKMVKTLVTVLVVSAIASGVVLSLDALFSMV